VLLAGTPRRHVLPAGTSLWRVHRSGSPATDFDTPRATAGPGGGRFDSVGPGGYPYLYGSTEQSTALTERFVRHLGDRYLPRKTLEHQTVSVVTTTTDLNLLRLVTGPDLAAVHQDDWLTTARGPDYDLTRRWTRWLREQVQWAQGVVWQSSIDQPNWTIMLFGDRCGADALRPVLAERLDDNRRDGWLRHLLDPFGVKLSPTLPVEKPRVFINYRSDNCGFAAELLDRELCRRLGDAAVFLDHRSIVPGTVFSPELVDKARSCAVLLAVIGRGWEDTRKPDGSRRLDDEQDWVRHEIREATAYGVRVVPVLVGTRPRLDEADLPDDVRGLVGNQYLHLPDGFAEPDVALVVDRLLERFRDIAC
jgi:hypothetical protein